MNAAMDPKTDDKQSALKRIAKIMNLAENAGSAGEAEAALAAAMRIATLNNIEQAQIDQMINKNRDPLAAYEQDTVISFGDRAPTEYGFIWQILENFFNVSLITRRGRGKTGTGATMIGKREDIEIATYVYNQLAVQYRQLWYGHKAKTNASTTLKRAYYTGLMQGMIVRLHRERNKMQEELALVIIKDPKISEAFDKFYPKTKTVHMAKFINDADTRDAGFSDSVNLAINKGVGTSNNKRLAKRRGRRLYTRFSRFGKLVFISRRRV